MIYSFIFLGIILGILMEKYLFVIFDGLLQVLSYKLSEKATLYQLNSQENVALFNRKYPEMNEVKNQELSPAIGFSYQCQDDLYFDDEDKDKNKIEYGK